MKSALIFLFVITCVVAIPSNFLALFNINGNSSRVIGGSLAKRHQFPYQVSLEWGVLSLFYMHFCGGSLISENWVLSAAHCKLSYGNYRAVVGQLLRREIHQDIQYIPVESFIVHPKYTGGVAANDIALLKLSKSATLSPSVQLVEFGTEEDCNAIDTSVISGWGTTSGVFQNLPIHLRYANLPRITNNECAANLEEVLGNSKPLDNSMVCTGSTKGQTQSACSGDSGGPLVRQKNGKLIGVVSWGITPCGNNNKSPSVFTRVCTHMEFINKHIF